MQTIALAPGADLEGFKRAARMLLADGVAPADVAWGGEEMALFGANAAREASAFAISRDAAELIAAVICHRDPQRHALLYELLWRLRHGEAALLSVSSDPLVHRLERMQKSVRRDVHKMHAFVRFRRVEKASGETFVAWFEPDHFILERTAPFFVERFRSMAWSILTPIGSIHWDRVALTFGPPGTRADAPEGDEFEPGWRAYYESTFNPARTNPNLMRQHMAKKYWRNMPETAAIPHLIQNAPKRVEEMIQQEIAMSKKRDPVKAVAKMSEQAPKTLAALNKIIKASEPMVPGATQAVLGEGPIDADIAFVGEQPGDQEDLAGRPFVGPAGQVFNEALEQAGIARREVYVTNAVKHFKFEMRGKRRLHKRPTPGEVQHYRWWLDLELEFVRPRLIVALGATAVLALTHKALPIGANRGRADFEGRPGYITVHPSFLLRLPDEEAKHEERALFVRDLKQIRALAAKLPERAA
jgi:uracil-DNA glycosylase